MTSSSSEEADSSMMSPQTPGGSEGGEKKKKKKKKKIKEEPFSPKQEAMSPTEAGDTGLSDTVSYSSVRNHMKEISRNLIIFEMKTEKKYVRPRVEGLCTSRLVSVPT